MNNLALAGDLDLNSLLSKAGDLIKSEDGKPKIDYKKTAETASQFTTNYIQDFAKREQDSYEAKTARDQTDENSTALGQTIGAVAGLAICTALGAPNPICGVVGGIIGGLVQGLFTTKKIEINAEAERLMDNLHMNKDENDKRRNANQMSLPFLAYGRDRMEGIVDIVKCIKEKAIKGKMPDGKETWELYYWVPYSLLATDGNKYYNDLYYAIFYVNEKEAFNDAGQRDNSIPDGLNECMKSILIHTKTDKRCFDEKLTGNTAAGYALLQMWENKIQTPSAVRKYAALYDDGQKAQHDAMLDKGSEFYCQLDMQKNANKTGKPVVCNKDDGSKDTIFPLSGQNILLLGGLGLAAFLGYKSIKR